jgi:hypothetical protein
VPTERLANNAQTVLALPALASDTILTVEDASSLPALSGGDQFTLQVFTPPASPDSALPADAEIVVVTAVSGNVLTVTRAAEPIGGVRAAYDHPAGAVAANVLTAASLESLSSGFGSDKNYVHSQSLPASTWVIPHGLGKYPSPVVLDSSGREVHGAVTHDSVNQLTIRFTVGGAPAGFSGVASLN